MQTCPGHFRYRPTGVETLLCEIFSLGVPHSAARIFPLEPPFDAPLMGFPSLGTQTLTYGLSSSEPTGR